MTTSTLSSSIARDLLNSISLINSLLNEIESDPLKSMEDQIAFSKVATTLKILYSKSNRHFESSPEAHREAFQKKFTFPSRFKEPATLAVIMSFIYTMIISYEHHCMSPMLTDADHIMYAQRLSKTHKREIAGLLIKK